MLKSGAFTQRQIIKQTSEQNTAMRVGPHSAEGGKEKW
jgi:hypothetical protein